MFIHLLEALRFAADQPCKRSNCGTVCLCGPCHGRRALAILDPSYQPRHRKNFYYPVRVESRKSQRLIDIELSKQLQATIDEQKTQ